MSLSGHLLILEPDQALRLWLVSLIAPLGLRITTVSSLETAVTLLASEGFDILLADIRHEGEGGALEKALEDYKKRVKAVFLISPGIKPTAETWLTPLMVLQKPLPPRSLIEAITALQTQGTETKESNYVVHASSALYMTACPLQFERLSVYLDNGVILDAQNRVLRTTERIVRLSLTEARLMESLLANHGVALPYEDLGRLVYGCSIDRVEAARLLSPLASRLRRKLGQVGGSHWLHNQRQLGYCLQVAATPGPLIE